jgi:hypothetical protein
VSHSPHLSLSLASLLYSLRHASCECERLKGRERDRSSVDDAKAHRHSLREMEQASVCVCVAHVRQGTQGVLVAYAADGIRLWYLMSAGDGGGSAWPTTQRRKSGGRVSTWLFLKPFFCAFHTSNRTRGVLSSSSSSAPCRRHTIRACAHTMASATLTHAHSVRAGSRCHDARTQHR